MLQGTEDSPDGGLEVCNALWVGGPLSEMAAASLTSFVEIGHTVRLYAYEEPDRVPPGVTVADAAAVVSRDRVAPLRCKGSYALFSDLFRYELLAREQGVWIDCDVLCVRPLRVGPGYVFGFEDADRINGAVLKIPADSPMLADLRAVFTTPRWSPPWSDWKRQVRDRALYALRPNYGVAAMSWGSAGPKAITHFARAHGVDGRASPSAVFYPVKAALAEEILRPGFDIAPFISDATLCIHLWADKIGRLARDGAPPGSFYSAVLDGTWRSLLPLDQLTNAHPGRGYSAR